MPARARARALGRLDAPGRRLCPPAWPRPLRVADRGAECNRLARSSGFPLHAHASKRPCSAKCPRSGSCAFERAWPSASSAIGGRGDGGTESHESGFAWVGASRSPLWPGSEWRRPNERRRRGSANHRFAAEIGAAPRPATAPLGRFRLQKRTLRLLQPSWHPLITAIASLMSLHGKPLSCTRTHARARVVRRLVSSRRLHARAGARMGSAPRR